jgi:hypothetical protein
MPATFSTKRQCPYCAARFRLAECKIVATVFDGAEFLDGMEEPVDVQLPSGTRPSEWLHKRWPVVAPAPEPTTVEHEPAKTSLLKEAFSTPSRLGGATPDDQAHRRRSFLAEAFSATTNPAAREDMALPALGDSRAAREELRARVCKECEYPLPQDIDERKAVVIAVVGVNGVGKSNLIAASLTEAYQRQGLKGLGCTEFVPDDASSQNFLDNYYRPLFRHGTVLDLSQDTDEVRFKPLVFNVTLNGLDPFSLVVHDIAGEALADPRRRARAATFLRAARGIIFVVDPRDIDEVRDGLPSQILEVGELGFDQGALLATCLKPNGVVEEDRMVPVALTVAKADLLPLACGRDLPFLLPGEPSSEDLGSFTERVRASSREVADFLEQRNAHNLLAPARSYQDRCKHAAATAKDPLSVGTLTYHAISALGSQPDGDGELTAKVLPLNCVDPLGVVLAQICQLQALPVDTSASASNGRASAGIPTTATA